MRRPFVLLAVALGLGGVVAEAQQPEQPLVRAIEFLVAGEPTRAQPFAEAAIEGARRRNDSAGLAEALLILASIEGRLGRTDVALEHGRESLDLWRSLDMPVGVFQTLIVQADIREVLGRNLDRIEADLEAARAVLYRLESAQKNPFPPDAMLQWLAVDTAHVEALLAMLPRSLLILLLEVQVELRLARVRSTQGRNAEALAGLRGWLHQARQVGLVESQILVGMGKVLVEMHRPHEARPYFERALEKEAAFQNVLLGVGAGNFPLNLPGESMQRMAPFLQQGSIQALRHLAQLDRGEGKLQRAEAGFREVRDRYQSIGAVEERLLVEVTIAELLQESQKPDAALERITAALEEAHRRGIVRVKIKALMAAGEIYFLQGRFREAHEHLAAVEDLCRTLQAPRLLAVALLHRAGLYVQSGQLREGMALLREVGAVASEHRLGSFEDFPDLIRSVFGCLAQEGSSPSELCARSLQAVKATMARESEEGGEGHVDAVNQLFLGILYQRLGIPEKAEENLLVALGSARKQGDPEMAAWCRITLASVAAEQGHHGALWTHLSRLEPLAQEMGSPYLEAMSLAGRAGQILQEDRCSADALPLLEQAVSLLDSMDIEPSASRWGSPFQGATVRHLLAALQGCQKDFQGSFHSAEALHSLAFRHRRGVQRASGFPSLLTADPARQREFVDVQREYEALASKVLPPSDGKVLFGLETRSLREIQGYLQQGEVLLSYLVSPQSILRWEVRRDGARFRSIPVSREQLGGLLLRLRQGILSRDFPEEVAAELHGLLLGEMAMDSDDQRFLIAPSDALHDLPFAVLWDGHRFLGERVTLAYVPNGSFLSVLRRESIHQEPLRDPNILVVGNPDGSLSHAGEAAEQIGHLLGGEVLSGSSASETLVRERLSNAQIVHIGAHGYLEDDPLQSYIRLARDADHDGLLTVGEVQKELDLRGLELVFLSACESSRGLRDRERQQLPGLARAFLQAGGDAVIGTLWPIDDEATTALSTTFFRALQEGAAADDALARAQAALRTDPRWYHPYYWAAFTLHGEPSPVFPTLQQREVDKR